jgi:NTE family protein
MEYHFKNLVFEGGGVKGIAYVGAMEVLESKKILDKIERVGGTSAGAINAALFALGFSNAETLKILKKLDFNNFMDDSWGFVRDAKRLVEDYGWYKGDFFHDWISKLINNKLGSPHATFKDLREANRPDLYVYGTNLSTHFGEIFSIVHTPSTRIADAVRISMSIPLFFAAFKNARKDVYVDGGVLNNFPVKLFDREKYLSSPPSKANSDQARPYYVEENKKFLANRPNSSPYIYNKETLGFRLDTKQEIGVFRDGAEPSHVKINDFFDYIKELMITIIDAQATTHLHSDDWHRTIYIETLGVGTTDFNIPDAMKNKLKQSGKNCAEEYFKWFDNPPRNAKPYNKP